MAEKSFVNETGMNSAERICCDDKTQEVIEQLTLCDQMTGLPNLTHFFDLAESGKDAYLMKGGQPVLLYFNFKGMHFFNMNYGFAEGDRMLKQFAEIIKHTFSADNSSHLWADRFAVITEESGLKEKLESIFSEWKGICNGRNLPVHVGIYRSTGDKIHTSVALDRAKMACGKLKESYSSCYMYYSQELSDDASQKQYIIENFDRALEEKQIKLYLQPIIRSVSGRVCDVEALARWEDPEKGIISPAGFIPALEQAGLIYKLDLYMVDQVLGAIKKKMDEGYYVVPHSINLSRSDFDACDIVEEIRKRVDEAGVSRDRITIEITESTIGKDPEFMKEQIERFKNLGFAVWMDDFGSGYSSLEVLQSIRFNLLKFDMSFMRRLDDGDEGRILLTELMRMATSLGVDTVCEGVETEAQVRFLQEIGCSKLQGFYYSKPISFEKIKEMFRSGTLAEHENPEESEYYERIGKANLFDLGVITSEDEGALHNAFNTLPIAIIEFKDSVARYVRSNSSYQEFTKRFLNKDILKEGADFGYARTEYGEKLHSVIRQCCSHWNRTFFDEVLPDGSVAHSYVQRISVNPVTGSAAIAIVVLSITEPDQNETFEAIAISLAADYYNIFVIDMDTNDYTEYASEVGGEELTVVRHGKEFFESAKRDTMTRIYEKDREPFLKWFSKENVIRELDTQGVFTTTYRLIDTGTPMYVNMKITRMKGGNRIILGISIIDAQMKQLEEDMILRQEKASLGRIAALSPEYIVLYTVDPEDDSYMQYNPSSEFASFGLASRGENFFADVVSDAPKAIDPEDIERHLRVFTKENMMREIEQNGFFIHHYRLMLNGESVPVSLKATLLSEEDGEKILLGVTKAQI